MLPELSGLRYTHGKRPTRHMFHHSVHMACAREVGTLMYWVQARHQPQERHVWRPEFLAIPGLK